jgi:hypothetical protein
LLEGVPGLAKTLALTRYHKQFMALLAESNLHQIYCLQML